MGEHHDDRSRRLALWSALLLAVASGAQPSAARQPPACGTTLVADFELGDDLTCVGTALVIGADGITLDLNGHTIAGTGTGTGVLISGHTGATIRGGVIRNFESGVRILDSTEVTLQDLVLDENTDGIDCAAGCGSSTFRDNEFRANRARGVMLRGSTTDVTVKDNRFSGNRVGVLLFGCHGCTIKDNLFTDSVLAGVRVNVLATGNDVKDNSVSGAPAGIEFLVTPTGSATGNAIVRNSLLANVCGLKGPLSGNVVKGNTFSGNGAEICP